MLGLSGQLELAKYILQSAHALELMTIYLGRLEVDSPWKPSNHRYILRPEKFAYGYLDPHGVYRGILKIVS
jgi:hypothetical protein